MKTFTIIGGVDGVGKSSFLGILSSIRFDIGSVFNDETEEQTIYSCLEKGMNLTWETTLTEANALRIVQRAQNLDYTIRLYYIGINTADESIERIKNRVRKGGHNTADDDVERRFEKRFEDLIKILPYCNEVRFYDNENGFVDVAEYRNGSLIIKGDYTPEWIIELKEYMDMGETEGETITPVIG